MAEPSQIHPHTDQEPCPGGCEDIKTVDQRLDSGDARMTRIEADLKTTKDGVEELLEILQNGKGFFKVLGYIATAIKWSAGLAAPLIGLWYVVKEGPHK